MNKKIMIIPVITILIIIIILTIFKLRSTSQKEEIEVTPTPTVALPTITDATKVELTAQNGNRAVILKISGIPADIESVEYELTYTTGAGLPKGVLGKIATQGETSVTRDDIVLGTCSSGKCVYDTGVTSIDLSLKFNSSSGNGAVFRKTYPL